MHCVDEHQAVAMLRRDELFRFVWERTADNARAAKANGDQLERNFEAGTLRLLKRTRPFLNGRSLRSQAAERYLRRAAQRHADHPAFRMEWLA